MSATVAANFDFPIDQGTTLTRIVTWVDADGNAVDLTGYTATFKIWASRQVAAAAGATLLSLSNGSGLTLGGTAGTVQIDITAAQTAALSFLTAYYALKVTSGSAVVTRLLEGKAILNRGA